MTDAHSNRRRFAVSTEAREVSRTVMTNAHINTRRLGYRDDAVGRAYVDASARDRQRVADVAVKLHRHPVLIRNVFSFAPRSRAHVGKTITELNIFLQRGWAAARQGAEAAKEW